MKSVFGELILSFLTAILMAPGLIHLLYKYHIVRQVETDVSHIVGNRFQKTGTPIMGGLLIVSTITIICLILNWNSAMYVPIAVLVLSAALGGIDDLLNIFGHKHVLRTVSKQMTLAKVHKNPLVRAWLWITIPWTAYINFWYALGSNPGRGLQAGEKILVQIAVGLIVAWWIYGRLGWSSIWIPIAGNVVLGPLMPVLIVFTVVSMTNAVNISDGMDGLASGMLIPAFLAFMIIGLFEGNLTFASLDAIVVGALLAYLYFNIKPARFEMGDVGSLALGSLLATVAFAQNRIALLPVIGFMFVLIIGSSLVQGMYRRIFGRRLIKMAPIHLHFQIIGWSEEKIVMRFWLFAGVFALIGIWLSFW